MSKSPLLVLVAVVLCMAGNSDAQPQVARLQPFKVVQVCLPFNVLIAPSPNNSYDVLVNADAAVKNALRAGVDPRGTLTLVLNGEFTTKPSIQVTVRAPSTALAGITTSSSVGAEVVAQGFSTTNTFTIVNNGATSLSILNLTAPNVIVRNPGAGSFLLQGNISTVSLTNTGAGTAIISGVTQSVDLNIGGVGNVYIDAAGNSVQIRGQAGAASLASVTFNRGQCSVTSSLSSIFGSPCNQAAVTVPSRTIFWTCGLTVRGSFGCEGSSGAIYGVGGRGSGTSAASSSPGSQAAASTSTSGDGSGFSQTITSSGGTVITSSSSDGQTQTTINGQPVNTSAVRCTSNAQQAVMAQV